MYHHKPGRKNVSAPALPLGLVWPAPNRESPYKFWRIDWKGPLFMLTKGWAVLDGPAFPILGKGDEEPNDTFKEQLVSSAAAAIDAVVEMGVVARDKMAVGGHSYGAFMTSHLLSHTDLFKAGLARSGAYNRSLTPFGFQSEQRTYWSDTDLYIEMSPFTHVKSLAQRRNPILLIHGQVRESHAHPFGIHPEEHHHSIVSLV
jgi:dipeptidyl aminopeptidase/acylaminoacyl peptidase